MNIHEYQAKELLKELKVKTIKEDELNSKKNSIPNNKSKIKKN